MRYAPTLIFIGLLLLAGAALAKTTCEVGDGCYIDMVENPGFSSGFYFMPPALQGHRAKIIELYKKSKDKKMFEEIACATLEAANLIGEPETRRIETGAVTISDSAGETIQLDCYKK